jgi:hypothetical protein
MLEARSAAGDGTAGPVRTEAGIDGGGERDRPRDVRAAVEAERLACRRIVEDHLRAMLVERRTDPVLLVRGIVAAIDARAMMLHDGEP